MDVTYTACDGPRPKDIPRTKPFTCAGQMGQLLIGRPIELVEVGRGGVV